jgi:hypothetical protein
MLHDEIRFVQCVPLLLFTCAQDVHDLTGSCLRISPLFPFELMRSRFDLIQTFKDKEIQSLGSQSVGDSLLPKCVGRQPVLD